VAPPPRERPPASPAGGHTSPHLCTRPQRGAVAPSKAPRSTAPPLAACQAALPGSRGAAYLRQRGVGSAAPGSWPHKARDWHGGRVVFPHTTPDGRLVNLYGRAVGTAEQVPKAKRHDHLPGEKASFNAAALQGGAGPLWVCEGAFDALASLRGGARRRPVGRGAWARKVRELVLALDADAAGQQQWRTLARQAALRGKRVAVLQRWLDGVLAAPRAPPPKRRR